MKRNLLVVSVVGVCALASIDASAKVTIVNSSPRVELKAPAATRGPVADAAARENWVGNRAIVRDVKTGKLRKPTATETRDMVKSIKQLTARVSVRTESTVAKGGVIEAAAPQVVVARATEDGGMETLCVQTFEEAAEFLGLVRQTEGNNQQ